jgi:hypothetical protein
MTDAATVSSPLVAVSPAPLDGSGYAASVSRSD